MERDGTLTGLARVAAECGVTEEAVAKWIERDTQGFAARCVLAGPKPHVVVDRAALRAWRKRHLTAAMSDPGPNIDLERYADSCSASICVLLAHADAPMSLSEIFHALGRRFGYPQLSAHLCRMRQVGRLTRTRQAREHVQRRRAVWVYAPGPKFADALRHHSLNV